MIGLKQAICGNSYTKRTTRAIRPVKVKMNVSNCFSTLEGSEIYVRIENFDSTTRKNKKNIFDELTSTLNGYNFLVQKPTSYTTPLK